VCARRASSSANAAAADERTPEAEEPPPKPLIPDTDESVPGEVPPAPTALMFGKDGIDGSEPPEDEPAPDFDAPGLVLPERGRILRSPSVGVNSLITLSTRASVTIFLALPRNAK